MNLIMMMVVMIMVNLEFKQLQVGIIITCISEDGVVNDLDEIKSELQDGLNDVANDIIIERNNVVASELVDVVELSDGDNDG